MMSRSKSQIRVPHNIPYTAIPLSSCPHIDLSSYITCITRQDSATTHPATLDRRERRGAGSASRPMFSDPFCTSRSKLASYFELLTENAVHDHHMLPAAYRTNYWLSLDSDCSSRFLMFLLPRVHYRCIASGAGVAEIAACTHCSTVVLERSVC